jgi:hypothetical protein
MSCTARFFHTYEVQRVERQDVGGRQGGPGLPVHGDAGTRGLYYSRFLRSPFHMVCSTEHCNSADLRRLRRRGTMLLKHSWISGARKGGFRPHLLTTGRTLEGAKRKAIAFDGTRSDATMELPLHRLLLRHHGYIRNNSSLHPSSSSDDLDGIRC